MIAIGVSTIFLQIFCAGVMLGRQIEQGRSQQVVEKSK